MPILSLRIVWLLFACSLPAVSWAAERPNILLIFTDDQGRGDVSCYGSEIPTPHVDSIGRDGIRFEDWYVAASICTPSRFGLLTGRYPNRSQDRLLGALMALGLKDSNRGIHPGETTIASVLGQHGYQTALIGKWHLGHGSPEFLPTRHGFDSFYGHTAGCIDYFTMRYGIKFDWYRDERLTDETGYATELITDQAVRFLKSQTGDTPFFLYLAYNAPHFGKGWDSENHTTQNIMQPHPDYLERFSHIEDQKRREYAAMVAPLDDGIGRVLRTLKQSRLDDDTLVIFMTDNGGDPDYGGNNRPFRGEKATLFEGGIRVPCLMRWPGKLEAGRVSHQPASALDLVPTICAITGIDTSDFQFDGIDLSPHLFHGQSIDRELFWRMRGSDAYRHGDWKYLKPRNGPDMLFHLRDDPGEVKNLAQQYPEKLADLKARHKHVIATFSKK